MTKSQLKKKIAELEAKIETAAKVGDTLKELVYNVELNTILNLAASK